MMIKVIASIASAVSISLLSTAASAQTPGANIGAQLTTDAGAACQGDAQCLAELQNCLRDLKTATETSKDALEKLNRCENRPKPPVKPVAVAAPVCAGEYMLPADCTCHLYPDGSGDLNPKMVKVRQYGTNNVICVTRDELRGMVEAMNRRLQVIEGKVQGWDDAKRKVDTLLLLVSNGEPEAFAAQWTDLLSWYAGAKQSLALVQQQVAILIQNDATTQTLFNSLCPPIQDKPQASMKERCDAAARKGSGTKVEARVAVEGFGGHRPGSGGYQGVKGRVELSYNVPNSQVALVTSAYVGHIWDQDTGRQIMLGAEGGVRIFPGKDKDTSIDVLVYAQQYYSVHGAGYQGMSDKGMGYEPGGRVRVSHCFTEGFCLGGDVAGGYTPKNSSFPGAYRMDVHSGPTFNFGLGAHGRIKLFE